MRFAPIVIRSIARMRDTSKFATAIDFKCDNFLSERGHFLTAGGSERGAGITHEDPAGTAYRSHRCMLSFSIGSERRDLSVLESPFDDLILVGRRLTDADINFITAGIDGHVAVAGPVMLCPALQEITLNAEDKCLICEVNERLLAEYVLAQRRDSAIAIFAGNSRQLNIRKFPAIRKIHRKCDKRALLADGAHHDTVAVP